MVLVRVAQRDDARSLGRVKEPILVSDKGARRKTCESGIDCSVSSAILN